MGSGCGASGYLDFLSYNISPQLSKSVGLGCRPGWPYCRLHDKACTSQTRNFVGQIDLQLMDSPNMNKTHEDTRLTSLKSLQRLSSDSTIPKEEVSWRQLLGIFGPCFLPLCTSPVSLTWAVRLPKKQLFQYLRFWKQPRRNTFVEFLWSDEINYTDWFTRWPLGLKLHVFFCSHPTKIIWEY